MKTVKFSKPRLGIIAAILLSVAMLGGLTSCDDDWGDPGYYDGLLGTWQLTGVPLMQTNEFQFFGDGTGYYYAYDSYGNWQSWPINYYLYGSRMTVDVLDGYGQSWDYQWAIRGNMLILNDLQYGGPTLYYQYVGN